MRFLPALLLAQLLGCRASAPRSVLAAGRHVHAVEASIDVYVIDVGPGSATFFEFPEGAILVDTNGDQNTQFHSNAAPKAYLDELFVNRPKLGHQLSNRIPTHPYLDHTRGTQLVADRHSHLNAVTNGQTSISGAEHQVWLHTLAEMNSSADGYEFLDNTPAQNGLPAGEQQCAS